MGHALKKTDYSFLLLINSAHVCNPQKFISLDSLETALLDYFSGFVFMSRSIHYKNCEKSILNLHFLSDQITQKG